MLLLALALVVAAALRFVALGQAPPGLYRDEAFNGLDALGVLQGDHALFFRANNGREPAYIYLTAVAIGLFGRQVWAVRLAAAVVGTLTTLVVFGVGRAWFGRNTGLLAAWLWAITLWPVHLSRIGLRPILLAPVLGLAFWLGTAAYRRGQAWLWLAAGAVYGLSFYTYLAARFAPILLAGLALYLAWRGRVARLWPGLALFGLAAAAVALPLGLVLWSQPEMLARAGQVSILNPAVNSGDLWGTLWRQAARSLGLFLWQGDTILRHNPAGRPVFDWLMAGPWLIGLGWCFWHWRRPAAALLLLWHLVMLGPTLLAEDAPHFLRAAGLLPAALLLPAVGLSQIWRWSKLSRWGVGIVPLLVAGSLVLTWRDYTRYAGQPQTAFMFEAAARTLAESVNSDAAQGPVLVEDRLWDGWTPVQFLVPDHTNLRRFAAPDGLDGVDDGSIVVYVWPHQPLEFIRRTIQPPALVQISTGPLARGDLDPEAFRLYVRYRVTPGKANEATLVNFADQYALHRATLHWPGPDRLQVDLRWSRLNPEAPAVTAFLHVVTAQGRFIGQLDRPPGNGYWPPNWWTTGLMLEERFDLELSEPFDAQRHQIWLGLYDSASRTRLALVTGDNLSAVDAWRLQP